MKVVKKVFKVLLIIVLIVFIGLGFLYAYKMIKPHIDSRKKIEGIEDVARKIDDLAIDENVKLIALGEATHGNSEFQSLKLDILKTLIKDNNVKAFGVEMDYAEGVIINDYITNHSNKTIDEIMNSISFEIYQTEDIKNLIEWMKEYNSLNNNELAFYGFDFQNPEVDLKVVKEFVESNHILEEFDLTKSFDMLINNEIRFKDEEMETIFIDLKIIQDELINNNDIYKDLYNYQRIITCIDNIYKAKELASKYSENQNGSIVQYGEYRDQVMKDRIIEILDIENKRNSNLMITGHNGHVGYAGSYVKTMGAYLKEELNDKYYVIGTDYYKTIDNIKKDDTRKNYKFTSCDILAYQAKDVGTYYLKFSDIDENSSLYKYIDGPINTGSIGESYSILNHLLPQTVRLYCEINYLYDGMIFFYNTNPIKLLTN